LHLSHLPFYFRVLRAVPTRRSSDLAPADEEREERPPRALLPLRTVAAGQCAVAFSAPAPVSERTSISAYFSALCGSLLSTVPRRSEEHTSELQSRENLVCRLLLEKK